jgi:hypothetical protein
MIFFPSLVACRFLLLACPFCFNSSCFAFTDPFTSHSLSFFRHSLFLFYIFPQFSLPLFRSPPTPMTSADIPPQTEYFPIYRPLPHRAATTTKSHLHQPNCQGLTFNSAAKLTSQYIHHNHKFRLINPITDNGKPQH